MRLPDPTEQYREKLAILPAPGEGRGFHTGQLGVANVAARLGVSPDRVFRDLRGVADHGNRPVPDGEIRQAVDRAYAEANVPRPTRHSGTRRPAIRASYLQDILQAGDGAGEADLNGASPVQMEWPPEEDGARLLAALYDPADILFIGGTMDCAVRSVEDWLRDDLTRWPHIIPNPMTGVLGKTKDGKDSMRADSCVSAYRFAVVEFDGMPREDQAAFWCGWLNKGYPLAAVIDSGGKSLHGWVPAQCSDRDMWEREVEQRLFACILVPMGVDPSCRNESRLSRMPGHFRVEKERQQRLLYLNPENNR